MYGLPLFVGIIILPKSTRHRHPNFLRLMGRSSKTSPDPYLVYHGGKNTVSAIREGH